VSFVVLCVLGGGGVRDIMVRQSLLSPLTTHLLAMDVVGDLLHLLTGTEPYDPWREGSGLLRRWSHRHYYMGLAY
jgi:hypothetical protein